MVYVLTASYLKMIRHIVFFGIVALFVIYHEYAHYQVNSFYLCGSEYVFPAGVKSKCGMLTGETYEEYNHRLYEVRKMQSLIEIVGYHLLPFIIAISYYVCYRGGR